MPLVASRSNVAFAPRRIIPIDVATLAELLHETAEHHDPFEKSAPEHNWWDWYAAYLNARLDGRPSEDASEAAYDYMQAIFEHRAR